MAAKIFISYSHRDEKYKDDLQIGLATLKNNGYIDTWDDRAILSGEEWDHEIKDALYKANIIILLVSPDFLASRYVKEQEIKIAMERHHDSTDAAVVVPVIIRPADWEDNAFARLQALPKNGKPISTWSNYDQAILDVVIGIKKLVMRKPSSSTNQPTASVTPPVISTPSTPPSLDIADLKAQVGAGKTEKVLASLLANENLEDDLKNQLIMQKNRWHRMKKGQMMGTLSNADATQESNRINYNLLQILSDLS